MAKFILQGTIIEEPIKKQMTGKHQKDFIALKVEEKFTNSFGDKVNVYVVEFFGKMMNAIPLGIKLAGAPVVVIGRINPREYNGNLYYNLSAEEFTIITLKSFDEKTKKEEVITQEKVEEVRDTSVPNDAIPDEDLPF